MPAPRNQPTRASQRRNSLQDETPVRTRGRGVKLAPSRPEQADFVPQKSSPTKLSPTATRKTTRSASNISGRSFEAVSDVYASYERPLLMVFGLSPEFFNGLKKHHGKLPKERKSLVSSFPQQPSTPEEEEEDDDDDSESEEESGDESEVDELPLVHVAPRGRGRGGRGSRGGRGRGNGRGRPRGSRGRGGISRGTMSARGRSARNAAAMVPLTEEDDDEEVANQRSPRSSATSSPPPLDRDESTGNPVDSDMDDEHAIEDDEESEDENHHHGQATPDVQKSATLPRSPPPPGVRDVTLMAPDPDPDPKKATFKVTTNLSVAPRVKLPPQSASQTPRPATSTPAEPAAPRLLDPEDDVLLDSDLPAPWIEDAPPVVEAECEDRADHLLQKRFKPMVDVQEVIAALTKYSASQRSTQSLFTLAANTQRILQEFQDQYLMLDARTAPHMHPPKKACNGGRLPLATDVFEDLKEADLYGYTYDPKKLPGSQDPWGQRPGAEKGGGRELRTRRNRDMLDSAPVSEEDDDDDHEGRPAKRQRKATRKFDGSDVGTGTSTPKKHNGWGGARKKGVSRFSKTGSETPEPESRPAKRARIAASNLLHQRIQEMREASLISGSGDEESSTMDVDDYSDTNVKRGRPAGSKNVARRSDYGVKKGPRKKTSEAGTPVPSAHGPNAPPLALQSMSEGQGQFSIDPQPLPEPRASVPNSAEAVFQATLQPSSGEEPVLSQPTAPTNPDAYMITAPLSQYTNNYVEDSSPASGSRRKPRVKSEKRSQSMTIWWAERKARKREQDEKNGTPSKASANRADSSNGRRGGRASTGSATAGTPTTESQHSASVHHHEQQHHLPPDTYTHYAQPPPLTAPSPLYMYASAPPPPPGMMLQYSPLAAIPSSAYPFPGPPPPSSQYGGPRALAPAPMALQQHPAYPSPYGLQSPTGPTGARPKSSGQPPRSGPPPLAPAPPQHYSPYAPIANRDVSYKVMIPPAPAEPRRESR